MGITDNVYFQGDDIEVTLTPDPADTALSTASSSVLFLHWEDTNTVEQIDADVSSDTFVATIDSTKTEVHTGILQIQGFAIYLDGTPHHTAKVALEIKIPLSIALIS